jgi:hypothetical protein
MKKDFYYFSFQCNDLQATTERWINKFGNVCRTFLLSKKLTYRKSVANIQFVANLLIHRQYLYTLRYNCSQHYHQHSCQVVHWLKIPPILITYIYICRNLRTHNPMIKTNNIILRLVYHWNRKGRNCNSQGIQHYTPLSEQAKPLIFKYSHDSSFKRPTATPQ